MSKNKTQLLKDVEALLRGEPVEGYAAGAVFTCNPPGMTKPVSPEDIEALRKAIEASPGGMDGFLGPRP